MPTEKTYMTWKFEEADDELKEIILDKNRYINVEDDYWYDYDGKTGFTAKELKRMKISVKDAPDELIRYKKLYFDIDRGWYIQFTDVDFTDDEIARKFLRVPKKLFNKVTWRFKNKDYGGSSHDSTRLIYESEYWENPDFTEREREILDRAVEIFGDKMEEALRGLRDAYEWQMSDEAVSETLIANDYDFDERGNIS